jgi:hypothetical protein
MDKPIFDKNELVYKSLAGYSTAHTNYLSCLDKNGSNCNDLANKLDSSFNELNNNIDDLYALLNNREVDKTNVKKVYDKNNKLRTDMASQLEDVYKNKGSTRDESNIDLGLPSIHSIDSSVYIGLVWTTMATACLYYIFVKL